MIILWGRARVFNNLYQECKANFSQSKTGTKKLKRKTGLGIDMCTNTVNVKCLRMMMLVCIKQHLSTIKAQHMKK